MMACPSASYSVISTIRPAPSIIKTERTPPAGRGADLFLDDELAGLRLARLVHSPAVCSRSVQILAQRQHRITGKHAVRRGELDARCVLAHDDSAGTSAAERTRYIGSNSTNITDSQSHDRKADT